MPKKTKAPTDFVQIYTNTKAGFLRYRVVIFVVFVALVYSFVFWQINKATSAEPDPLAASSQAQTSTSVPNIEPDTIKKIEQLKDNSVNVKALFDKARNNPFAG